MQTIYVLLDNIRSALNVGAIFRTCDAVGVDKLYLCGITAYPPHNKIPKTALGAENFVKWDRCQDTIKLIKKLKKENFKIYSVEITKNSKNMWDIKFPNKTVLIFGNEITGVPEEIMKISDEIIKIPMFGKKESLNVATSVGIVLYEAKRQFILE